MCWLGLRLNIRRCWGLSRFLVQPLALLLHRGSRAALLRRRLRTAGYQRHRQSACRHASGRLLPKTLTTLLLAFGQLTARCGSAWKTPCRVIAKMTATGSMPGEQAGHVGCPPPSSMGAEPKHSQPPSHRPAGPALRPDQRNNRRSDRLQGILDRFVVWTQVCFQAISMARGMLSACREVRTFVTTSRCRTISALSPSTTALWSPTRTSSRPATRVCRSSSIASSNILRGLSRAWLLLASSAELPTGRARTPRSPTFT